MEKQVFQTSQTVNNLQFMWT